MKTACRYICFVVVLAMIFSFSVSAADVDEELMPAASAYFSTYCTQIYRDSGSNQLELYFDVLSIGTCAKLGAQEVLLMQSSDRINWTTIRTYTSSSYPGMIASDTNLHAYSLYTTVSYNYYYKIHVTFYAYKNATNLGRLYDYSDVIYVSR